MFEHAHPSLVLAAGAALLPFAGRAGRRWIPAVVPVAALIWILQAPAGFRLEISAIGMTWTVAHVDGFSRLFAVAFAFFACLAGIYSWREPSATSRAGSMLIAAAGIGVALAGDLLSLFLSWELMTVGSVVVIAAGRARGSDRAAFRYLAFHLAGGFALLAGILLLLVERGSAPVARIGLEGLSGWLILIGFCVNAAVPPLHAWLPDAYPRASPFGTVALSAFTTKAAVYTLLRCFPGEPVLVWAGAAMALYGVIFAVLENDIRRLLGYHIVSQVGYMVCGVGIGTAAALAGVAAHAFCHIFYKGLLLMAAGAVVHAAGSGKLTELGGIARQLWGVVVLYMIGAFAISGVPLFSGFVSKSIIVSASAASAPGAIELMLVAASMGTFLHTGLKLPWFAFFARPAEPDTKAGSVGHVPPSMYLAMTVAAAVCVGLGVLPSLLYRAIPDMPSYEPYTADHVVWALQLLAGTGVGFRLLLSKLGGEPTVTFDVDRLYRRPISFVVTALGTGVEALHKRTGTLGKRIVERIARWQVLLAGLKKGSLAAAVWVLLATLTAASLLCLAFGVHRGRKAAGEPGTPPPVSTAPGSPVLERPADRSLR